MCEVENKRTIFDSIGRVLKKGWEAHDHPTISRTNVYVDQINKAQEKIEDPSISNKERRYYKKQTTHCRGSFFIFMGFYVFVNGLSCL